jgi:glycosyltransferase involved in cell wall biosynthesis
VLFMPAHDEQETVGACVTQAPATVGGHPVEVLVIDDGSSDQTASRARAAGAGVISLPANQGLGAAVRAGLAEAVAREAAAVAFCDADGEYPPAELAALVQPILDGSADYVVGSRFLGTMEGMRPHRRLGNLALTRLLSIAARRPISDGQSGYRAFSLDAAARAEIIHDFNYAQVLTLDLLAKGFRYAEVPITYRFRQHGRSFIRVGAYLRQVVPAIRRELRLPSDEPRAPRSVSTDSAGGRLFASERRRGASAPRDPCSVLDHEAPKAVAGGEPPLGVEGAVGA